MTTKFPSVRTVAAVAAIALLLPLGAQAQNIAVVNGKPVPKSRVDTLLQQASRGGQQLPPNAETQAREQVVLREIFAQEVPLGAPGERGARRRFDAIRLLRGR